MATVPEAHSTWQGNHENLQEPRGWQLDRDLDLSETLDDTTLTTIYDYPTKDDARQVRPMMHTTRPMTPMRPIMIFSLLLSPCDARTRPCYRPMLPCLYAMLFSVFVCAYETDMSAFCSYVAWLGSDVLRCCVFKPMYFRLA